MWRYLEFFAFFGFAWRRRVGNTVDGLVDGLVRSPNEEQISNTYFFVLRDTNGRGGEVVLRRCRVGALMIDDEQRLCLVFHPTTFQTAISFTDHPQPPQSTTPHPHLHISPPTSPNLSPTIPQICTLNLSKYITNTSSPTPNKLLILKSPFIFAITTSNNSDRISSTLGLSVATAVSSCSSRMRLWRWSFDCHCEYQLSTSRALVRSWGVWGLRVMVEVVVRGL